MIHSSVKYSTSTLTKTDGIVTLTKPTFFTCGCGSITSRLSSVLPYIPLRANQLPQVRTKSNRLAQEFIKQNNLTAKIPKLSQHVYGVLIAPDLSYVDISVGDPVAVAKQFTELLDKDY